MKRFAALATCLTLGTTAAPGQQTGATARAESLRAAGRPWHAAEALLAATTRDSRPDAALVVEGAKAELHARRYDRAKSLLIGQPWLDDYRDGEALAVLAEAELRLGQAAVAAEHFRAAAERATGPAGALRWARAARALEGAGRPGDAATAYAAARGGLAGIEPWLRVRQARVTRDTAAAFRLLADVPASAAREVPAARAGARLGAADTLGAIDEFARARDGLAVTRLAWAVGDSARARAALYELMARAPESDDAGAAVAMATRELPPRDPSERVALARAMRTHGGAADALMEVERAVRSGDSSAATLLLLGELRAGAGKFRPAEAAYTAAARDSAARPLALYRRARVLVRLSDGGAPLALSGFAEKYPADTAAPTALYLLSDMLTDQGDLAGAGRWMAELIARYPTDPRASLARFRLAARAIDAGRLDSAAALYRGEIAAAAPQRTAARFWLGVMTRAVGDTQAAIGIWTALAREDSLGYYGLRARREVALPPVQLMAPQPPAPSPAVAVALARIDTLTLAGLDTAARAEVRAVLANPPTDPGTLLAWSEQLGERGWGPAAVRLGWLALAASPGDARALRAIWLWPNRGAVEGEAREFDVDPFLLVAIVRQESVFDAEALSRAGARGLAQLLPGTAALMARDLDVTFYSEWITVPDLNLHLGAAHLADLLRRFGGRTEAAIAAYNAGSRPVTRWLERPGADDPDQFIELIPYPETRGYVRAVLRNRELYRALYALPSN